MLYKDQGKYELLISWQQESKDFIPHKRFWINMYTQFNGVDLMFKWPIVRVREITSQDSRLIHYQLYLSINLAIICTWWCKGVLLSAWLWVPGVSRDHYFPISPSLTPRMRDWGSAGAIMCHWHRVSQHPHDPWYWHHPRPLSQDIGSRDQGCIIE